MSSSLVAAGPGTAGGTIADQRHRDDQSLLLPTQRSASQLQRTSLRSAIVLLVDPDRATREPLKSSLVDVGIGQVIEAPSVAAAEEMAQHHVFGDLALVSLQLGAEAGRLVQLLRQSGWTRTIALASTADIDPVIDAVGAGVSGVLIGRRANPAAAAIPDLSSREIEVIRLVADGRSNKWIGKQLSLSALTVKSHLARIGRKLGTGDRAHMVALAMRAGVIA